MEMERVPAAGYEIVGLPVAGFDRRRPWRNFRVLAKLWKSMRLARKVLKDFRPDACVGVGGYASGPMLKEAQKRGIPTLLQEQNSYAGVTNKLLAKKARAICVAYEGMERFFPAEAITLTGNPVRHEIATASVPREEAKKELGFDAGHPLVVVVGGSLGARTINEAMIESLGAILETGASVLWQTGKLYSERCQAETAPIVEKYGADRVQVVPFVGRMDLVYRAADVMVSRAGASTISEIQLTGVPSILVPSPNVAEDHQTKNARALSDRGAAILVTDAEARDKLADTALETLADEKKLSSMRSGIAKMALRDADEKIVDHILEIINKK